MSTKASKLRKVNVDGPIKSRDICGATIAFREDGDFIVIHKENFATCLDIANRRYSYLRRAVSWFCGVVKLEKGTDMHRLIDTDPKAFTTK